ncbi:phage shock protein C [Microbacteriaceae bacterium SG_E_30_P1]|uniref:Phage shock protein C n=1 Tax=Antiquaquibacter oligotrophicus TaxID=2880260 RepID=A0ABT6KJB4_9MICO|nr:PspC domain-containing protein [Antiquaquibacter oligotrophicus]MDH6180082.1 phage shock protein C [Antiquaquibacter oligotrophicus]UDF14167.1 PspC domain-containing protein [Antiquaquibacter oligotrophicus]
MTTAATGALVRPKQGRMIAGVSLAIANRFGWNLTLVRLLTALAVLFTGVGLIMYIALWIIVPSGV